MTTPFKQEHNSEQHQPTRDYSKLRKAAASQSLELLKDAIRSGKWTAEEIDDNDAFNQTKGNQRQRQHASKSALHMAAWKGCLDNVKYLVESLGCNIDAYSTQEFSYGKTAIFFALTQSRVDVTEYLLEQGAKVTIVNNKGQSVLSMAATHFPSNGEDGKGCAIVEAIQRMEIEQGDWWNFRASHSDGFEYGDLDPRFFDDRKLRSTDIVTPLAINPTTKETRKGGFLRRNPGAASRPFNKNCEKKSKKRKPKSRDHVATALSFQEQDELDHSWESLSTMVRTEGSSFFNSPIAMESISKIVRLNDKQRLPWIPETTTKLERIFEKGRGQAVDFVDSVLKNFLTTGSEREKKLLEKLASKLRGKDSSVENHPILLEHLDSTTLARSANEDKMHFQDFFSLESWRTARNEVKDLQMSCLENGNSAILTLPHPPTFVDTRESLNDLLVRLRDIPLISIDTEWCTMEKGPTLQESIEKTSSLTTPPKPLISLATLQIAFLNNEDETDTIMSYVVDLKEANNDAFPSNTTEYSLLTRQLVKRLLIPEKNSNQILVLGFSIRNDIPYLESFLSADEITKIDNLDRDYRHILDLQSMFASERIVTKPKRGRDLPGLKRCASRYSKLPLSKECQCSDWGKRPLSQAQLAYAGLDAAVLLFLLAERSREEAWKVLENVNVLKEVNDEINR